MSELAQTVKIEHNGEIRKIKAPVNYEEFLATVAHKFKVDPKQYEIIYESNKVEQSSVPKIYLQKKQNLPDSDIGMSFDNIAMTESTVERPLEDSTFERPQYNDNTEGLGDSGIGHEEFKLDQELHRDHRQVKIENISSLFDSFVSDDTKPMKSDEKCTATDIGGIVNSNSVQTQSVANAHASTDVQNLVENNDQNMGTESVATVDRSNQKEVALKESAVDPITPKVNNQSINTNLFMSCDENVQVEDTKADTVNLEEIESKLSEIVQHQLKDMTPMLIQECQKYIEHHLSEIKQKEAKKKPVHNVACDQCNTNPIVGDRYLCIVCQNLSFCSKCESEIVHKHPMMKIRSPESFSEIKLHESLRRSMRIAVESDSEEEVKEQPKEVDPIIQEEPNDEPCEFPEMVKRSVMMEYKPFDDTYINKLKCRVLKPDDCVYTVSAESENFNMMFEILNDDTIHNTRWPIYTTIVCEEPLGNQMINCTMTNKETRPGVIAKFTAKMQTPKDKANVKYVFKLADEYGRSFGDKFIVKVKVVNFSILNLEESDPDSESAFAEPHEADKLYPHALTQLKDMGVVVTDQIKDVLMKVKGRVEEVFEHL